jgi:hypothetical protein
MDWPKFAYMPLLEENFFGAPKILNQSRRFWAVKKKIFLKDYVFWIFYKYKFVSGFPCSLTVLIGRTPSGKPLLLLSNSFENLFRSLNIISERRVKYPSNLFAAF